MTNQGFSFVMVCPGLFSSLESYTIIGIERDTMRMRCDTSERLRWRWRCSQDDACYRCEGPFILARWAQLEPDF